ncbi:S9 family peptidase [Gillisia limnaea]|uniref:Secreted prolyl oligopeptidase family protein n=1 Tax=Gillisia limnaea (strain DSM 15749 / LMG 21470 / R-8282) TaxID=865937 RepID=H2BUH6_GILLR|nr:S9 family peptidase [Gillisia limnaea]EHQ03854.1 secreted prolyl oligopeptidase family protein [Gillisia limnaea DSM 15749]
MNKNFIFLMLTFVILFSCKKEEKKEEKREIATYSIEQFMDNESVYVENFSPDKAKLLVTSNRSGIFNIYTVPAAGGDFTPITQSDSSSIFAISYFPEDERILFRMDDNGDEIYKIYVKDGDSIQRLTPAENARALFYGWTEDETAFYYGSNQIDNRFMDLYKMDIESFTAEMIYQNAEGYDVGAISEDEKYLALSKSINTNDSDLFLYNLENKQTTKINMEQSANSAQAFSEDNQSLFYTTDVGDEFANLMKYNLAEGTSEKVLEKDWDIVGMGFSENGKYQVTYINQDAANIVEVLNTETGEMLDLPEFDNENITGINFTDNEAMALLSVGGSHTPTNTYTYDLETKKIIKITDVLNDDINQQDLVRAEVVRYPSFDGQEIPAIYYKPLNASNENPVPALVLVHGGPGGQSRQGFSSVVQYLVNHGYAILAVNNRGSSGYGKSFFQMDDQKHGEEDLQDVIEGKNWLAKQPEINGEKIGIMGGSYGGFMTMAALTFAPEEFDVGVNLYGVTNWMRTLKSIPPWWESFKESLYKEMGDPNTADSIRLKKISPLFHTENVTKPLLVLQGSQDPRVLKVESDEIVEGVRKSGVPVEYVLFEDEGHGFVKKENQIEAYEKTLEFLDKYLKGGETNPADSGANSTDKIKVDIEKD